MTSDAGMTRSLVPHGVRETIPCDLVVQEVLPIKLGYQWSNTHDILLTYSETRHHALPQEVLANRARPQHTNDILFTHTIHDNVFQMI